METPQVKLPVMILEGIVTTTAADGSCHTAAMGPHIHEADWERASGGLRRLTLKPFGTSATFANLLRHGEGVFHITDDAVVIAELVLGCAPALACHRAANVDGFVLEDACVCHEFRVVAAEVTNERGCFEAEVVASTVGRPFRGLNRASHAVIEAAILISRLGLIDREVIAEQLGALAILVEKTGGVREREVFARLRAAAE